MFLGRQFIGGFNPHTKQWTGYICPKSDRYFVRKGIFNPHVDSHCIGII
ncbi:hypothetical protein SAMN03080602_03642 [Arenibacter troitsensis]|uniref:Uncharacterized protein n=1 Tax=Arenibacter troitsensis TaxID=188872 RepID=A0A1X7L3I2_9FLAO|nr:hypothetical protein SAMN03080602_03642 [Arenibacter troitsensis]